VGFRPFVYQLARSLELGGWVRNTSEGVIIEAEGERERVEEFLRLLREKAPPVAEITALAAQGVAPTGEREFSILSSDADEQPQPVIPADIATCADCEHEVADAADRRFHYPFTNCTNCGPRFTIIRGIPYDRPKTTMSAFRMCPDCRREYDDPADRRFHAQPNACPRCGPRVELDGTSAGRDPAAPVARAGELLGEGRIIAVKGLGGFHLACDARCAAAVRELRQRKGRSDKPFALMVRDLAEARRICLINDEERKLLESPQRPIVLLRARPGNGIAPEVAPENLYLGLMLPYTPLHRLLFETAPPALVMTSGNLAEEPICHTNEQAAAKLGAIADHFLTHDRDIYLPCDDSVARVVAGRPMLIRRSRGYVPRAVAVPFHGERSRSAPPVLAVGGEERNTFCMLIADRAVMSQHLGDLDNVETLDYFQRSIEHLGMLFRWQPKVIAHDLHPEYLSTKYVLKRADAAARNASLRGASCTLVGVQHHHAHAASVMADAGVEAPVIAASLDGAGYGTDGAVWGGEFLVASLTGFERIAHLAYVPMPGGAAAVRRPGRMALAHLMRGYGDEAERLALELMPYLDPREAKAAALQAERGFNSPMTSSMGRLFDAVSALLGICEETTYTGQPAVELEMAAQRGGFTPYPFAIDICARPWQIDPAPIIRAVVDDIRAGVDRAEIAARFHHTVAALIAEVCEAMGRETGLSQVALGGGVFQNAYLLELLLEILPRRGLTPLIHSQVPPNDGGLALGQAVIAAAIEEQRCASRSR
jgi:hydrogenase maturation protein HypF